MASIAADLLCWLRLLCLDDTLADAEPKTLRYRTLHTAVRLVRGQRKRKIKIPGAWPWARELEAAFLVAFAWPRPDHPEHLRSPPTRGTPTGQWNRRHPTRPVGPPTTTSTETKIRKG